MQIYLRNSKHRTLRHIFSQSVIKLYCLHFASEKILRLGAILVLKIIRV